MEIIIILGLIILNGILSMSEIALVSARKARLETLARKGKKSARKALRLASEPDRFLSAIQTGITLIGILTGLFSGEAFAGDLAEIFRSLAPAVPEPYPIMISKLIIVVIVTYLTLVLGELVPKRIGMGFAEQVAMLVAKPMDCLSKITAPFVWILSKSTQAVVTLIGLNNAGENSKVTEEEIKAIVHEGYEGGEVQEVEQDIVERVFYLGDRTVGSIMTHRSDLVWIDMADSVEKIRGKVKANLYNTYPVASGKFDNIKGVVYLKDLFGNIDSPEFSIPDVLRPAQFIQENMSVYRALEQFRRARVKYGIVTDEFGSVQGIVTLKDIIDALIGEVREVDDGQEIVRRQDGSVLVDGQYSFYSFLDYFDMEYLYGENDYNTLSGLILEVLERVPRTGDTFSWMNFDFEIVDMDGARIDKVLVRKNDNDT
ncbi:MAG: hemolysin family protein [Tannerella sp.]|jgi:putative hemolysin|nr:hemolysin family protein [Tannerella sp.]